MFLFIFVNLLDVGFICRCPFIDEIKILKWIGHFMLKEKRENDKKSNHHSENSMHTKSIHWVVFDMSMYIYFLSSYSSSSSLSLFSSLYPSILAHDIKRKKGKFILIGSNEKKKSQYKVKIQSTPENFLYNGFEYSPLSISFFCYFLYR